MERPSEYRVYAYSDGIPRFGTTSTGHEITPYHVQAGIAAIPHRAMLESYYLLHSVLGDFEARLGRHEAAAAHFQRALGLTAIASEQAFLTRRLEECGARV